MSWPSSACRSASLQRRVFAFPSLSLLLLRTLRCESGCLPVGPWVCCQGVPSPCFSGWLAPCLLLHALAPSLPLVRRLLAWVPEVRRVQVKGAGGVRLRLPGAPRRWLFSNSPGACGQSPRPRRLCAPPPPCTVRLAHVSVRSQLGLQEGFGQQSRGQH